MFKSAEAVVAPAGIYILGTQNKETINGERERDKEKESKKIGRAEES